MPEMDCKKTENQKHCTCTYTSCSLRGICCECIESHRERGEVPGCLFPPEYEKTYDRSISNFIRAWQDK